jgi:hypothetical protein
MHSKFQVRRDTDGTWFIGQPVERRFLWWRWTAWVNVLFAPGIGARVFFPTKEAAQAYLETYASE